MARRIVHVSDLHFGADDPRLVEPLLASLAALRPDLVVVSGDLTQRATRRQFEAARDLIARFPAPVLAVPGNHDIPLLSLPVRLATPRRRWERWLRRPWTPDWQDDEMIVASIDSPRPWRHKEGVISTQQLERVREVFTRAPESLRRIVVAHHPLAPIDGLGKGHPVVLGAHRARHALRECGTDVVLSGHLHVSGLHHVAETERKGLLFLQAPSALSHRLRGEENGFYVVDFASGGIASTLMSFDPAKQAFVAGQTVDHPERGPRA